MDGDKRVGVGESEAFGVTWLGEVVSDSSISSE